MCLPPHSLHTKASFLRQVCHDRHVVVNFLFRLSLMSFHLSFVYILLLGLRDKVGYIPMKACRNTMKSANVEAHHFHFLS